VLLYQEAEEVPERFLITEHAPALPAPGLSNLHPIRTTSRDPCLHGSYVYHQMAKVRLMSKQELADSTGD